jgi:biotin operon repressor
MLAFVGDRPFGYEVCHGDGDPANNNRKNLRYDTPAGNAADKRLHGTNNEGDTNPRANFTAEQVMGIYQRCKRGESQTVVADELGISSVTVNHIATGRTWGTVTGAVWVRVKLRMTPLLVRQIDQLQQSGKTLQEIADELNLSKPTVFRHSKGKSKLIKEGSLCI